MEKFGQWLNEFSNTKVGIIIATTISVLLILVYIFSKTSIGRKALIELRSKAITTKSYVETTKEVIVEELKKQKEKTEKELELYKSYFESFRQETFEVLKVIPNAKVKKFVKDHENLSVDELVKKYAKDALKGEK